MIEIFFKAGTGCSAMIGEGAACLLGMTARGHIRGDKAALITDDGVPEEHVSAALASLRETGLTVGTIVLPHGEEHKRLSEMEGVFGALCDMGITREDGVVGLGGGVVLDMAGFAAATYLRGVSFISVPTTIIAQTDSAYGGKTGVDLPCGKNLVGVFSHPAAVVCDTGLLRTLPERERICGMGEVIKYGAIEEPRILASVSRALPDTDTVAECVKIKRRFTEADEFDRGERRILNFGHTYGHAIEAASGYTVPHGQAVAYGMLAAVRLGTELGITAPGVFEELEGAILAAGLDNRFESRIESARPFIARDKKSDGDSIDFVLLKELGKPVRKRIGIKELL